jgi:hypothetical protein
MHMESILVSLILQLTVTAQLCYLSLALTESILVGLNSVINCHMAVTTEFCYKYFYASINYTEFSH